MQDITLCSFLREKVGKNTNKKLRRQGLVPSILYGRDIESIPIKIKEKEFKQIIEKSGQNVIINLEVIKNETKDTFTVMIKEVQIHPLTSKFLHIDFQKISLEEKMVVTVPVHLIGESKGVKEGGILDQIIRDIEVKCLPTKIPQNIEIDVSELNIGDVIYVKDIKPPEDVEIVTEKEEVIVTVLAPAVVEVAEEVKPEEEKVPEVVEKEKEKEEKS
jgi:large subunit ribosomal protein L25